MPSGTPEARLRTALELFELGEQMMRTRLHRERPDLDEEQVQRAMQRWLHDRPGAPFGDYPGPPSSRTLRGDA